MARQVGRACGMIGADVERVCFRGSGEELFTRADYPTCRCFETLVDQPAFRRLGFDLV
jgi:hypothetical protein